LLRVGVSKCLLGFKCRYNAKDKLDEKLIEEIEGFEVIPFCPEEVLGVPREPIDIVNKRLITQDSKKDVTKIVLKEAKEFIAKNPTIDIFYLKSKSPSCAFCSAKEYDEKRDIISTKSMGIFAKELKKWYKSAKFYER
jgi:uncharacterized protein YbbK (DUF523 family)